MRNLIVLAALAIATPAFAAGLTTETVLGTSLTEVQGNLAGMGYDVRKSEIEDGKIEIYAVKGNKMAEIYVDAATGKIFKLETK